MRNERPERWAKTVGPLLYGESMFESQLHGLDAAMTMSLVSHAHRVVVEQECALLDLAAHWADLQHPARESAMTPTLPGGEQARLLGGDGTPQVLEFAAAELGARMETTTGSARSLMADALDLRHRLPELWALIRAGRLRVWRARKVSVATRHLSLDAARQVDGAVAPLVVSLPWNRFEALLAAKIIEADPKAAEEQAKIWEAERFVRSRNSDQSGLRLLIARANAGDVIWFMATVNRIADILHLRGDFDSADARRSKAIGILAQPALALQLLWEFRGQQRPAVEPQRSDELIDNQPDPLPDRPIESPTDNVPEEAVPDPVMPDPVALSPDRQLIVQPTGLDHRLLRPQVVLNVHLSHEALLASLANGPGGTGCGPARIEGVGSVTLGQLQRLLAQTACEVTVQPVIDPEKTPPTDAYEVPRRMREAMFLRMPASCFPFSARASRRVDLDHTMPYRTLDRGGPPGQTAIGNLGPLSRSEHRLKTHSRWRVRQPEPGVYLWRSPTKAHYLVTNAGTFTLGDGSFAKIIWDATAARAALPGEDTTA